MAIPVVTLQNNSNAKAVASTSVIARAVSFLVERFCSGCIYALINKIRIDTNEAIPSTNLLTFNSDTAVL